MSSKAVAEVDDAQKAFEWTVGRVSMTIVAFQFAFQPYLTSWYMGDLSKNTFYIFQEASKILISFVSLLLGGKLNDEVKAWDIKDSLTVAFVPAGLYVVQNFLIIEGAKNMDGLLFNVVNQTKVIFAAVFLQLGGIKRYSTIQYGALLILLISAVLLTMDEFKSGGGQTTQAGVICCVGASMLSGLNSAIIQRALQNGGRNSFTMTAELAFYGLVCLYMRNAFNFLMYQKEFEVVPALTFELIQILPVITNAFGGTFVGLTTKYAGSVYKGYALAFGLIISGCIRATVSGLPMSILLAIPLVISSLSVYNAYPYVPSIKVLIQVGSKQRPVVLQSSMTSDDVRRLLNTKYLIDTKGKKLTFKEKIFDSGTVKDVKVNDGGVLVLE